MTDQPHRVLLSPVDIVSLLDSSPIAAAATPPEERFTYASCSRYPLSPPYEFEPPHCLEMLVYDQELAFERLLKDKDKGVPGAEWPVSSLRQKVCRGNDGTYITDRGRS